MNDSNYPWFILVPRRNNIKELYQLSKEDRIQLVSETDEVAKRLSNHFQAAKMNIAALGNIVPQLHVHVIVRRENDASWPNPVWNGAPTILYNEIKLDNIITDVKKLISNMIYDD